MNEQEKAFCELFTMIAEEVHETACEKGFHDNEPHIGIQLMNIVGEVGETNEAMRAGNPPSEKIRGFSHAEEEMADTMIRIMDTARSQGWRLPEAVIAKMMYNKTRARMHGKKY